MNWAAPLINFGKLVTAIALVSFIIVIIQTNEIMTFNIIINLHRLQKDTTDVVKPKQKREWKSRPS